MADSAIASLLKKPLSTPPWKIIRPRLMGSREGPFGPFDESVDKCIQVVKTSAFHHGLSDDNDVGVWGGI